MAGLPSSLLGVDVYWKWEIVMGQEFFSPCYLSVRCWDIHRGWQRDTRTGGKGRLREATSSFFAQQPLKELSERAKGIGQKVWSTLILHIGKKKSSFEDVVWLQRSTLCAFTWRRIFQSSCANLSACFCWTSWLKIQFGRGTWSTSSTLRMPLYMWVHAQQLQTSTKLGCSSTKCTENVWKLRK